MATADIWRASAESVRAQIVENCSFFSPSSARLSVILTRETLGTYKAFVLRAEPGGQREALLASESAGTVHGTFELLLIKSADAVQNYITTNGFEFAPSSKKVEAVVAQDDDDGASSVTSSEMLDDDRDKNLGDSTSSLSEAESAYDSVSEDGVDVRYPRARATHTMRDTHAYSVRMRRSRSPKLDDPDFPREGRQQRGSQRHYSPHHNLHAHRRRPSPVRGPDPNAVVDGPLSRHVPAVGGAPPAGPPPRQLHTAAGSWRPGPGNQMPPPVVHTNAINVRADAAAMPRPHPSQYFTLHHPPPPPGMRMEHPPPSHQLSAAAGASLQQHTQSNTLFINGINRDIKGPSPVCMPSMAGPPMLPQPVQAAVAPPPPPPPPAQAQAQAAPPTPPASSSLSSTPSSTPILTVSPNKPPFSTTPPLLDYRVCIRSRSPNACLPGQQQKDGTQAGQQQQKQWHAQRIVLRTPPTRTHIRAAVLRFVEFNPDLFGHLLLLNDAEAEAEAIANNNNNSGNGNGNGHRQQLPLSPARQQIRVALTRVVFGDGESYDLSTYAGDDLGRLCAGMGAAPGQQGGMMPLFEVTVSNAGPLESFFTL